MKQLIKNIGMAGLLMVGAIVPSADATVSLRNGNFFIGYADIVYSGGINPKVERAYNSKTSFKGIFGYGWGTELETYLEITADGGVVLHEFGGGAENRFFPVKFTEKEVMASVAEISAVAKAVGSFTPAYATRLKTDVNFRNDEWTKFVNQGKLKRKTFADGTQFVSNRFRYQYLTKVKDGYVRTYESGKSEKFDAAGHLVLVSDKNSNSMTFSYAKDGKLEKIVDNFNRKLYFTFDSKGLVSKIQGESNQSSEYKYNDALEMVYSKDAEGNVYTYKYSTDQMHNMTEIGYSDKSTLLVSYYGSDKNYNVKTLKERDGTLTEYSYFPPKGASAQSVGVAVVVKDKDGKAISNSQYEYHLDNKFTGEETLTKMVTINDGERTETTYDTRFNLPSQIKRGTDVTSFKYDPKGRLVFKETPFDKTELSYDASVGKVSKVSKFSKTAKRSTGWSEFKYDKATGNLTFAKNSEKKSVTLLYDRTGRITSMLDQAKRRIDFKYNENSKPIEIIDPKLGSIKVSYTNSGDIKNVESSAGRKIALEVTSTFQNLLEIVRPAGVSLSF